MQNKILAWAKKTANSGKYKYVYWKEPYGSECAVCHPHDGKNKGWQCIGWSFACWFHGGLPTKCNCGVIDNGTWNKILKAKTDADANKIAQNCVGSKDIVVIRNKGKAIPQSKLLPGDIFSLFDGNGYYHTCVYIGNGQLSDCTSSRIPNIKYGVKFAGKYASNCKVAIRYTGKTKASTTPKKTVDQLAQEVIQGKWGSGDERKKKLTKAGYNYNAVQKRVNEIIAEREKKEKEEKKGQYKGELPTLRLKKTNAEVIADTIKWAKWIVGDNRFHYGYTSPDGKINAHHNGCYFCKTQKTSGRRSKKGIVDYQFTYCCNPFVGAAWAHGGCVPKAISLCQSGTSWDFSVGRGYDSSSLFTKLGHPPKSSLKAGDVLCWTGHVVLYIGNGKVAEASGGDDNIRNSKRWNNSIRITTLTDSYYKRFPRVYRFNGSVDADILMRHGEVSKRVALWQAFLDWYFDGKVGKADGCFGDNTLKWTKKFQEECFGKKEADGLVGNKTLAKAKTVKKK